MTNTHRPKPSIPGRPCDGALQDELRRRVAGLLGTRQLNFPGSQPVSFTRAHIEELKKNDYFLCEKSDGIRVLLYLTTIESSRSRNRPAMAQFLIDRKNTYYMLPQMPFPSATKKGQFNAETLVDGELVIDSVPGGTYRLTYLIFDCLVLEGRNICDRTLDKRTGYLMTSVIRPYGNHLREARIPASSQPFDIKFKKMERGYALPMMLDYILPNLTHDNDGLIFTRRDTPYTIGTDDNILKWKPADQNSVDFRLKLGDFPHPNPRGFSDEKPTMELYSFKGRSGRQNQYEYYAPLRITDDEWEVFKGLDEILDGRVLECCQDEQGCWRYKPNADGTPCFRDDKPEANHVSIVEKIRRSIEDGVSQEELLSKVREIEQCWKEREAAVRASQSQGR